MTVCHVSYNISAKVLFFSFLRMSLLIRLKDNNYILLFSSGYYLIKGIITLFTYSSGVVVFEKENIYSKPNFYYCFITLVTQTIFSFIYSINFLFTLLNFFLLYSNFFCLSSNVYQ